MQCLRLLGQVPLGQQRIEPPLGAGQRGGGGRPLLRVPGLLVGQAQVAQRQFVVALAEGVLGGFAQRGRPPRLLHLVGGEQMAGHRGDRCAHVVQQLGRPAVRLGQVRRGHPVADDGRRTRMAQLPSGGDAGVRQVPAARSRRSPG